MPRASPVEERDAADKAPEQREQVTVGLVTADGVGLELAQQLARRLPRDLERRFPDVEWHAEVSQVEPAELSSSSDELLETVRRHLLERGWDLAVGLTELPLRSGHRPVSAYASATHGVALVSVPALGAVQVERRLEEAVVQLVDGLLGEMAGDSDGDRDGDRHARINERLEDLASALGDARVREDGSVRFVGATLLGNLRLLVGMVRANHPSRVIARLSRALLGALGTGAFSLASVSVWQLADAMTWPRLLALSFLSVSGTCLALVLVHGLWERAPNPDARERVVLFNLATCITLALGVLTLHIALFAIAATCGAILIPPSSFERQLGHAAGVSDYLYLAWLIASLATIGGALGSMAESDAAVRNAAYRYMEGRRTEED